MLLAKIKTPFVWSAPNVTSFQINWGTETDDCLGNSYNTREEKSGRLQSHVIKIDY